MEQGLVLRHAHGARLVVRCSQGRHHDNTKFSWTGHDGTMDGLAALGPWLAAEAAFLVRQVLLSLIQQGVCCWVRRHWC